MSKLDNYQFDTHLLFDDEFNKIINRHKCPTLKEDFERLKIALVQYLEDLNRFPVNICNRIAGLDSKVKFPAFIVKNFRCKGINKGSRSGFRITFLFSREEKCEEYCINCGTITRASSKYVAGDLIELYYGLILI